MYLPRQSAELLAESDEYVLNEKSERERERSNEIAETGDPWTLTVRELYDS